MDPAPSSSTDALLAESAWMRRLARLLITGAAGADADDAVQDALVVAFERGDARPKRAWLAAVLRNGLRMRARGDSRRQARERTAGVERSGVAPAADEVAARLDAHRRLVEAVAALEEPYRETIALRFLEDLAPLEVAERMGVPTKTVHTRVERGLARLRERLDRAFGGREAWCVALGELGRAGVAPPSFEGKPGGDAAGAAQTAGMAQGLGTAIGGIAMGTTARWVGAAAVAGLAGWALVRGGGSDGRAGAPATEEAARAGGSELVAAEGGDADLVAASSVEPRERSAVPADAAAAPAVATDPDPAPAAGASFDGRVIDLAGRAVGDALVVFASEDGGAPLAETRTDADGAFELPLLPNMHGGGRLFAATDALATVVAPALAFLPPPSAPTVVVGPLRRYGGRVVDEDGLGLAGVEVVVVLDEARPPALDLDDMAWRAGPFTRVHTADDGRFELPPIGFVPGMEIDALEAMRSTPAQRLPDADALDLVLTMRPVSGGIAGRVVDALGEAVADAYVFSGGNSVRTDAQGTFALRDAPVEDMVDVRAVAPGFQPAELDLEGLSAEARSELLLVLDGPALGVTGRVLDASGEPVPGARVWTFDETELGFATRKLGSTRFLMTATAEGLLGGREPGEAAFAECDAEGRFELAGLLDRDYALRASDPETFATTAVRVARGGESDVVLRVPAAERTAPVAGVVTSLAGEPIAGAVVTAVRRFADPNDVSGARRSPRAGLRIVAETDEDGAFRFDALAVEGTALVAATAGRSTDEPLLIERAPDLQALRIAIPAPRFVRVRPTSGDGDSFGFVDAAGEHLQSTVGFGTTRVSASIITLSGFDGQVETDERAAEIVLYQGGAEVRRIRLDPPGDEPTEVDL